MSGLSGISLHIGINRLDPACYPLDPPHPDYPDGWDGPLKGCEKDARDMYAIAQAQGFESSTLLLTSDATADSVTAAIRAAAERLKSGDIFMLSYAGHGGQVLDRSGDEEDREDETWCLFDRHFLDDELYALYAEFAEGVRILVFSDSCHSGTVTRGGPETERSVRSMPRGSVYQIYKAREDFYNEIQDRVAREGKKEVAASILLLSACQDDQEADGGEDNGAFTGALRRAWNDGAFEGGYDDFLTAVRDELKRAYEAKSDKRGSVESSGDDLQVPNMQVEGVPNREFVTQKPFSI